MNRQEIQSLKMTLPDVTTPDTSQASAAFWMYALHTIYPASILLPHRMKFETVVAGAVESLSTCQGGTPTRTGGRVGGEISFLPHTDPLKYRADTGR